MITTDDNCRNMDLLCAGEPLPEKPKSLISQRRRAGDARHQKPGANPASAPKGLIAVSALQHEEGLGLALDKLANYLIARSQKTRDEAGGAIAHAQPDELRRMAKQKGSLVEVRILGDNSEFMTFGPVPDAAVVGFLQTNGFDMRGPRK